MKIVYTIYTPVTTEGARRHFQAKVDLLIRTVDNEDCRWGADPTGLLRRGENGTVVHSRNEPGLADYHRSINACLAEADDIEDQ